MSATVPVFTSVTSHEAASAEAPVPPRVAALVPASITAGIDAGSRAVKAVVYDHACGRVLAMALDEQGVDPGRRAEAALDRALAEAGLARTALRGIVATGYGRQAVRCAGTTITEITCHARGVRHLHPDARTVIEIGGQDSKCILLDDEGQVRDFAMNDRCAAGSGRFLEVAAVRLGADLHGLGALGAASRRPAPISSTCVVFAETEIVGLLAREVPPSDIAAGVQSSIAARVAALVPRSAAAPLVFTGGVALLPGMVHALEAALERPLRLSPLPQFTGALGAALLACPPSRFP